MQVFNRVEKTVKGPALERENLHYDLRVMGILSAIDITRSLNGIICFKESFELGGKRSQLVSSAWEERSYLHDFSTSSFFGDVLPLPHL